MVRQELHKTQDKELKWYLFSQNPSGGSFIFTDELAPWVWIEAHNEKEANMIAESKGIYFNGCAKNFDCDCCGDRWDEAYYNTEFPLDYGNGVFFISPEEYTEELINACSCVDKNQAEAYMYYNNGDVRKFYKED